MPVSYRAAMVDLLGILERDGGYRVQIDQDKIARARTLLEVQVLPVIVVICNIPLCPSRLELGPLTPEAIVLEVERMKWWTDGHQHVCPSHSLMEGLR